MVWEGRGMSPNFAMHAQIQSILCFFVSLNNLLRLTPRLLPIWAHCQLAIGTQPRICFAYVYVPVIDIHDHRKQVEDLPRSLISSMQLMMTV